MARSQSSWIEIFNQFLPRPHSRSGDLKRGMPASAILLHNDIGEAVERTDSSVFDGRAPRYREGFLQAQFEGHMSRAEVRSRWSRLPLLSALLPLHPKLWFHGQDLPLMCLSDRVLLHLKIARVPCRWLFPQRPLQRTSQLGRGWDGGGVGVDCEVHANLYDTPHEKCNTIMNSIGRSSGLSSHLPHNCGLRWIRNILRHTAASERELPTTADLQITKFQSLTPTNRMSPNFQPQRFELGSVELRNVHRGHEEYRHTGHMDDYIRLLRTPGIPVAAPSSLNLSFTWSLSEACKTPANLVCGERYILRGGLSDVPTCRKSLAMKPTGCAPSIC